MKMLQNTKTKEVYPMNGDMARHENVVVIDIPNMAKVTKRRGVAVLEEEKPKPARKTRRTKAQMAADAETGSNADAGADAEVDLSPETDSEGDAGGDDTE